MAWNELANPRVPDLTDATFMASLKGNIEYLHTPNYAAYNHPGTGGNYTVTGELGQDVDATNFNLSLTTTGTGGLVAAVFQGQFKVTAGALRANIVRVDTVSQPGRNLFNSFHTEISATDANGVGVGWIQYFDGLPAGTHSFKLVWGISPSGGTGTLMVSWKPRMAVWEV